ncbi:hypothetical protein VOLCADRAFT_100444 [Volvox carteri f. nagariensis]|uniref:Pherophorin domain-containing protein n=1 Tax=Volvox carteri f. nagariensis TaxID=3068 RepID=D8UK81_VOLCA|nr:uncharacterized protein VOLCADRAFT_100444 [Volvox carteri f. nagariensis]EFJ39859.1 hypothetical protein VOLCADRAFT_100444 [Volvox carteri f. nagariensis]|eukprot:XP_002959065.1 hypothetical protein VOLCADRAFT_100444 [Volvox carteri f. nagariensis]
MIVLLLQLLVNGKWSVQIRSCHASVRGATSSGTYEVRSAYTLARYRFRKQTAFPLPVSFRLIWARGCTRHPLPTALHTFLTSPSNTPLSSTPCRWALPHAHAPTVAPWLLPPELLPGVAYFDAESGVTVRNGDEEAQIAATWADVFASRRPCNTMQLEGRCRLLRQGGAPAAVSFDGTSCTVTLDDYLSLEPAWEAAFWSPDFTAVWVMMQAEDARPKAFSFEGMLQCAVEDKASAASSGRGLPPLPSKQWTMEVLSKSTDEATGVVTQKYFRYSQAGLMSSQRLRQGPCGVLLPPSGLKSFAGDVAVVLLYDRAVEESEVRDLATFYGSRFGWGSLQY